MWWPDVGCCKDAAFKAFIIVGNALPVCPPRFGKSFVRPFVCSCWLVGLFAYWLVGLLALRRIGDWLAWCRRMGWMHECHPRRYESLPRHVMLFHPVSTTPGKWSCYFCFLIFVFFLYWKISYRTVILLSVSSLGLP